MKITRENIEELMFDYFEGHLSDQEKSDFLNYLHLHPELEKDFTQWAQTYAHVEEKVPEYGLTAKLLRSSPYAWYTKSYWLGTGALVLAGVCLWVYMLTSRQDTTPIKQELPLSRPEGPVFVKPVAPAIARPSSKAPAQSMPKLGSDLKGIRAISDTQLVEKTQESRLNTPELLAVDSLEAPSFTERTEENPAQLRNAPDTAKVLHPLPQEPKVPKRKGSKRPPIDLKPSEKFLPVNPNF